nr:hypothetical protein BaRGS_000760 [Batillaria attramentaria]
MSTPECDDSSCPQKGGLDWADPGIAQLPEDEDADEVSDESADKADVNVNTNASSKGRTKSTRRLQGGGEVPDNQADGPDDDVTSQAEMDTQSLSSSGDSSSVNSRYG